MDNIINIDTKIETLSIEEKVAQLFIVQPESLMRSENAIVSCDSLFEQMLLSIPIGGLVYFGENLIEPEQVVSFLNKNQSIIYTKHHIPLFQCIDEEGGIVSRIANNDSFHVKNIGAASDLGSTGDISLLYEKGKYVGKYLSELGFNVDFAPCADILTNPGNTVIGNRAYSNNPRTVGESAVSFASGLLTANVIPVFKHFPGHGDTVGDSHLGYAFSMKGIDDLFDCEMIPYIEGINMGIPMIMIGHISFPNISNTDLPATLSPQLLNGILRERLRYKGVVITDSLKMKAISDNYSSADAAILSIEAGADLLLMPSDFYNAYFGLIAAVKQGRIPETRVDESLKRILELKYSSYVVN